MFIGLENLNNTIDRYANSLRAEVAPSMLTSGNGKTLDMFAEFYAVHST